MKKLFVKTTLVLLLAGLAVFSSSFKNEKFQVDLRKETMSKNGTPFTGNFSITSDVNGSIVGTGIASHVGKFTWTANDNEETFPDITGTMVITAANGDQIFVTHTGYATDLGNNTLQADFDNNITGGTGRFKGATGSFHSTALITETSINGTISGSINY
jgi:hypothetical protein